MWCILKKMSTFYKKYVRISNFYLRYYNDKLQIAENNKPKYFRGKLKGQKLENVSCIKN